MKSPLSRSAVLISITSILLLAAAGCGDDDSTSASTSADTSSDAIAGLDLATCGEVEFGGDGTPAGLIVSDLPMQGDSAERSEQQVEAIRLVLEENDWSAAGTAVAFQACDDSIAKTGLWDEETCRANADAYAADDRVLGVIGTYNSGCAAIEIPILNEQGVAMVSPGNTAVCLTERSGSCETIDEAGAASAGMYASVPGSAPENLSEDGVAFAAELEGALGGAPVEQFAPYAGEAAAVLLDSISAAGEDRKAISAALLEVEDGGGILKPYDIEPSGDPSVGPITILKASDTFEIDDEVVPREELVAAARG